MTLLLYSCGLVCIVHWPATLASASPQIQPSQPSAPVLIPLYNLASITRRECTLHAVDRNSVHFFHNYFCLFQDVEIILASFNKGKEKHTVTFGDLDW